MVIIFHHSYTVRARAVQACERVGRVHVVVETANALREFLRLNRAGAILLDGSDEETPRLLRDLRSSHSTATVPVLWLGELPKEMATTGEDKILVQPDVVLPMAEFDLRLEVELQRIFLPASPTLETRADSTQSLQILVIDDSLTYRMQLQTALTAGGYLVTVAVTGEEGLEVAKRNRFDAVMVDNMLPGIQGADVIRRLRRDTATRHMPCILLTASEDPESELDALEAGADTFIRKDEVQEAILLRLAAVLRATSSPITLALGSHSAPRVLIAGPRGEESASLRESMLADGVVVVEESELLQVVPRALRDTMDLVVITLPHAQALDLCRRLKATPQLGGLRVLMMECLLDLEQEAGTIPERQIQSLQAGADDYLTCALPRRNLRARLETQLRRKQAEDENRALHDHILRQQVEADSQRRLAKARTEHAEELRLAKDAVEMEAREAEAARHQLEQVMEALPQMVLMASNNGDLMTYNSGWVKYTNELPQGTMPELWAHAMHPDDVPEFLVQRRKAYESGTGFAGEFRLRSRHGEYRWFYLQILPMTPDHEQPGQRRWLTTCTDVHDRRLAEEALRRTEKLAATGRLAASIAHEINNPLEAVTNLLFLAEMNSTETGEVRGYVQSAQKEVARVSEIAKKTLAFYRENKSPEPVDLTRLLEETRDVYAVRMRQKQIMFELEIRTQVRPNGLGGELRQVVSNLLANAIDASYAGGAIRIRMRDAVHPVSGRKGVRILVSDRGPGIPERLRPELFKPFITTKGQGGTGLGLWVATSIAARHEGELRFYSSTTEATHGTCFAFFLPAESKVTIADDSIGEMMRKIGSELLHGN